MKVITRFAPSPTGYLHIGGARTALFNYLFAQANQGKYLLRIEDTDKARSTDAAIEAIFTGLKWLGLEADSEAVFQSKNIDRHLEIAYKLVEIGAAYKCFTPQEEINKLREEAKDKHQSFIFKSPWRDAPESAHPQDTPYVIRIKAPQLGESVINDLVQGDVKVENKTLDDFIIRRSDGTPTYMLSVVVDDFDMEVTHVIRGDDHLNNAFRQKIIYEAVNWELPQYAHIPLIHGSDGSKLSKRHGALGVDAYKDMGYLAEAINNYLLRLGWSHGDDEIISREQAIEWFNLEHVNKAPAQLNFDKLKNLNGYYIRHLADEIVQKYILAELAKSEVNIDEKSAKNILHAADSLKQRAELISELADHSVIYIEDFMPEIIEGEDKITVLNANLYHEIIHLINDTEFKSKEHVQELFKDFAKKHGLKLGGLMNPLRVLTTGKTKSPSIFELVYIMQKETIIKRIERYKNYVRA